MQKQIKNNLVLFNKIIKPTIRDMDSKSFEEFVISNGKTTLPDFLHDISEINNYEMILLTSSLMELMKQNTIF